MIFLCDVSWGRAHKSVRTTHQFAFDFGDLALHLRYRLLIATSNFPLGGIVVVQSTVILEQHGILFKHILQAIRWGQTKSWKEWLTAKSFCRASSEAWKPRICAAKSVVLKSDIALRLTMIHTAWVIV